MEWMNEKYSISDLIISAAVVVGGAYTLHHSLKHLLKLWDSDDDFPIGATTFHHPFIEPMASPCHLSAEGVFSLLTGISCNNLDALGYSHGNYEFDKSSRDDSYKTAILMGLTWKDFSITDRHKLNHSYHALVYCDGYLYQSYRTSRFWWLPIITDAYPLIRMKLKDSDIKLFEDRTCLTASDFNRLCAPSTNPIPETSTVRCIKFVTAKVNPTRRELTLTRDRED